MFHSRYWILILVLSHWVDKMWSPIFFLLYNADSLCCVHRRIFYWTSVSNLTENIEFSFKYLFSSISILKNWFVDENNIFWQHWNIRQRFCRFLAFSGNSGRITILFNYLTNMKREISAKCHLTYFITIVMDSLVILDQILFIEILFFPKLSTMFNS